MKNNSKNRNLKFIRCKNNLRLGVTRFYCAEKVSTSINCDDVYWQRLIDIAKKSLMKEYKLSLPVKDTIYGYDNDDFIKKLMTNTVILSK